MDRLRLFVLIVPLAAAAPSAAADPPLPDRLDSPSWEMTAPLVLPRDVGGISCYSIKDPSVVRFDGRWHLFCTVRGKERSHAVVSLSFVNWADAQSAERHLLSAHDGFYCAPQVFYFAPQQRWYLVCQAARDDWTPNYQPAFSTTTDIADPQSWSQLRPLYRPNGADKPDGARAWLDFWVICDDAKAHLFFTSLDGKMWRAETPLDQFPHGWTDAEIALETDLFEASHTYRVTGGDGYVTVVEAQGGEGWRYQKLFAAERLEGPWQPVAASRDNAFASMANVDHPATRWTDSISHVELLRSRHDQRLEVDPARLRLVFQGVLDQDRQGKPYGEIPWKLGILEAVPAK